MKIEFEEEDFRPVIDRVVGAALKRVEGLLTATSHKLAFAEDEAAAYLSVKRHVLRDARLRGEIEASKVGKRVVYRREQLLQFLERNRC